MNNFLYITADRINTQTGGGLVTFHESEALKSLGPCEIFDRDILARPGRTAFGEYDVWEEALSAVAMGQTGPDSPWVDPWVWDGFACYRWRELERDRQKYQPPKFAHFYAGTFTTTIKKLKEIGCKVSYTAAAHNIELSKQAHLEAGIPFDYPHLTDPELWKRYVGGYLAADVVICPSTHSADVMRSYGCKNVEIIPHGVDIPETIAPLPKTFTVGYMGSYGPDKNVPILLKAWKKLAYRDSLLVLAGRDSNSPYVQDMVAKHGGGNIVMAGWVDKVADFYNSISLYVQPSWTEGFGCEVLEAQAHGRAVLCST